MAGPGMVGRNDRTVRKRVVRKESRKVPQTPSSPGVQPGTRTIPQIFRRKASGSIPKDDAELLPLPLKEIAFGDRVRASDYSINITKNLNKRTSHAIPDI